MRKRYKFLLSLIFLGILVLLGIFITGKLFSGEINEQPKVVDSMKSYDYTLEDRDTPYMKDTYNELKEILNKDEVDKSAYASVLTKLFIIDLFTIDNKRSKYDVGGAEYVYPEAVANYKVNVEDTLYKSVKSNANGKRKQDLPIVKSVTIDNVEESEYELGEEKYNAFIISASWEYVKDLGYDDKAKITCIQKEGKIYIVEYAVGE